MRPTLVALLVGVCAANPLHAAPTLKQLFPAGGQQGTTTAVEADGTFDRWPVRVWASGRGVSAVAGKEKGTLAVTVAADAVPGTYWLRVSDDTGASGLLPFAVGTLPEVAEAEPNDRPEAPQPIDRPAVVNGRLAKAGDVDCYAVRLTRGQTLVASLAAHDPFRSPMDAVLQVVTADGFVLDQNHDSRGLDPQLAFTAPADGRYLVRLFAFPATPDSSIRFAGGDAYVYRLTLTTGGFADFAVPLAVPAAAPGRVRLEGWNLPPAARAVVPATGPPGVDMLLTAAGVANAVGVRIEPHPCFDLTATPAGGPLAPPFTATGLVAKRGGAAGVPFTGAKGKPLVVRAEARALGLPLTPVLQVSGADGAALATAEPPALNADSELTFTPPADGGYRVEVRDRFGGGGPRYAFRLRVVPAEPDFELTVASDRFTLVPGTPLEVPVTVVPRHGFTGEVSLTAEGLPDGVTAESRPASGKALTVRLAASRPGLSGAVRITGRAVGRPGPARAATAKLADFDTTTADLWLTVTAVPAGAKPR